MRSIYRKGLTTIAGASMVLLMPTSGMHIGVAGAQAVRSVRVNLRDVELDQVAEQIARITGRTIVLDPAVGGRVSVVSSGAVTPAGAWELFQAALRVHGFAAVRSGNVWRVVPQAQAVQGATPIANQGRAGSQEVVTRVIRLQSLPSAEAVRILRPLVASFGSIEASTRPNAVIVTDYAENVKRIERLARSLDVGGGNTSFQRLPLRHADATQVGEAIQLILGDEASGGPRVAVDERSNVVLVRGSAAAVAEARRIAASLDTPSDASITNRVIRLRHADAESVAGVLRGLLSGGEEATNPVARALAESGPRQTPMIAEEIGGLANQLRGGQSRSTTSSTSSGEIGTGTSGFSTPDLAIQAAPELNAIVMRGSAVAINNVEALIAELDVRRPQVRIEAAIVEITGDVAEQFGVQLGLGSAAQVGSGAGTSFSGAGVSLRNVLSLLGAPAALALPPEGAGVSLGSRGDFGVFVQALAQSTKANLLSTPSLTTLDNEPGEIVVGQNVPFRTGSFATEGNTLNPFTTIERQDVGITLRVVPRVHEGNVVKLEVSQEVSSLINANVAGAADLITNRRSIQTTVLADDGETIALGGLITDDRLFGRSKVPVLGDIPVVGELFKSKSSSRTKRTLFVFLRATILRDQAAISAAAASDYSRIRADEMLLEERQKLLQDPPGARLPVEIDGVY